MEELKFNSQICTTKEQSQHLLDLGLKPETADMVYEYEDTYPYNCNLCILEDDYISSNIITEDIPAWSLHRLLEMIPSEIKPRNCYYSLTFDKDIVQYECYEYGIEVLKSFGDSPTLYDNIIDCVAWLIKENLFNKEYLKQ